MTTPHFKDLTIFFPMWNEEDYIEQAVHAADEACRELVATNEIGNYEILIVNDASTDDTGKIANELAASSSHVRVIHHEKNRRLGGSLKTGFANARGELVLYSDADLPFDFDEIRKACRLMRVYQAHIVSAFRLDRTAEGPRRGVYSFGYNGLVQMLFGIRLRDVNFAFKLCRRSIFDHIEITSEGSFIDVELLVCAHQRGYKIIQFGVDYFARTRGISTLSSFPVIVQLLEDLVRLKDKLKSLPKLTPEQLAIPSPSALTKEPEISSNNGFSGAISVQTPNLNVRNTIVSYYP
jgi:glycosyltransferase involved in cell wall biosynthesis